MRTAMMAQKAGLKPTTGPAVEDDRETGNEPAASPGRLSSRAIIRRAGTRAAKLVTTGLAVLVAVGILAAIAPSLWGWTPVRVYGGSMGDALPVGSMAVMARLPGENIGVGDIIAVRQRNGVTVIHRVTEIHDIDGQRHARLKGDANATADPNLASLSGDGSRLVYYVPLVGYILWAAGTPYGMGILAGAILACWLAGATPRRHPAPRSRSAVS